MKTFHTICISFLITINVLNAQECLNVDYKLRGYFYVGTSLRDTMALGGHYQDSNGPKKVTPRIDTISIPGKFQIVVKSDSLIGFSDRVQGFKVFIINKSQSTVQLPAQDSRLYLTRQVFHKNKWQDIEYLPNSWCGNSYHSVFIKPNEFWDLQAPCLNGKVNTKFRFKLNADNGIVKNHNDIINYYSNEFYGSFNPSQLEKEEGHVPQGIMDPYDH